MRKTIPMPSKETPPLRPGDVVIRIDHIRVGRGVFRAIYSKHIVFKVSAKQFKLDNNDRRWVPLSEVGTNYKCDAETIELYEKQEAAKQAKSDALKSTREKLESTPEWKNADLIMRYLGSLCTDELAKKNPVVLQKIADTITAHGVGDHE